MRSLLASSSLALVMAYAFLALPAAAADYDFKTKEAGQWNVRVRALAVLPDESGDVTSYTGAPFGLDAKVADDWVPEVDVSYFFTKNIAAELIAATSRHDVTAARGGTSVPVGKVSLLPPTLTAQYHFQPDSRFSPYIGAGLNYTIFYRDDAAGGTITRTRYSDSLGYALQAGVDYAVTGGWSLNFDVKKIFLDTTVKGDSPALGPWKSNVNIDPVLVGMGIGYRF